MTNPRSCATGKRPLSHYHGNRHPETCYKCSECGYFHENAPASTITPELREEVQKVADDLAAELPADFKRACDLRPMDRVMGKDGNYHTLIGFNHSDNVVELLFEDREPEFIGFNTPVQIDTLDRRLRDAALADAVAATAKESRQAADAGDDFGMMAFDWMESAIRMLRAGEWAERHPANAMLRDLETLIGDAVISGSAYHEIQPKFRAAVKTLESLGYSYNVDGAEMWRPPHGQVPDYIQWERAGDAGINPPVGAQVVAIYKQMSQIIIGKVLGIGDENIIIEGTDNNGDRFEVCDTINIFTLLPYDQNKIEEAQEYAKAMANHKRDMYSNEHLKFGLLIAYRDQLKEVNKP